MLRFILKRLISIIPVLIGISLTIFIILQITPGDPARSLLSINATEEEVQQKREELGLNEPILLQYVKYVNRLLHGDLGKSWMYGYNIREELSLRIPRTLILALLSIMFTITVGIPAGVISAVKQYSIFDNFTMFLALFFTSIPTFWFGLMSIYTFSLKLGWLPVMGMDSPLSLILPTITCGLSVLANLLRTTRSTMLEIRREDYVRTARAKGVGELSVIIMHTLRNALLPIVTLIGLNFGVLMGGAVLTESVFVIPGIGTMMINSVKAKDIPVVMACIIFTAMCIALTNLFVDILYTFIDPTLKSRYFVSNKQKKLKTNEAL